MPRTHLVLLVLVPSGAPVVRDGGVRTAAMSLEDATSSVYGSGSPFGEWITKNVK